MLSISSSMVSQCLLYMCCMGGALAILQILTPNSMNAGSLEVCLASACRT